MDDSDLDSDWAPAAESLTEPPVDPAPYADSAPYADPAPYASPVPFADPAPYADPADWAADVDRAIDIDQASNFDWNRDIDWSADVDGERGLDQLSEDQPAAFGDAFGEQPQPPTRDEQPARGGWVHVARWNDTASPEPVAEVAAPPRTGPDAGDFLAENPGVADRNEINYGWPRVAVPDSYDRRPATSAPEPSIDRDRGDHDLVDDLLGTPLPDANDPREPVPDSWAEPAGFDVPASEPEPPPAPVIGRVRASARVPGLLIERPPVENPRTAPDMFVSARLSAVADSVSFAEPAVRPGADVDPEILAAPIVTSDAYASLGDVADPSDFAGPIVTSDAYASLGAVVEPDADEDMDRPLAVPRALGVNLDAPADRSVPPLPPADLPYSNEDWRSTVRGSAAVVAGPSGTVYRGETDGEAEVDEPISVAQRILRYSVVLVLLILFVVAFVYGPSIDQWFNK